MNLREGTLLQGGKYRIERELGHGGFGITYLAMQTGLNRKVAIKEFFMAEYCNRDADTSHVSVPSEGSKELVAKFRKKFIKEAQTIAEMDNHHIIRIYDVFEDNGTAYYVMEYLQGGDLRSRIPSGGMPETEAVGYIREVADALRYIHAKNILHLDIKPTNILFRSNGEAVLIDFGISKHYDDAGGGQTSSTPVGISEGYAPTEQYEREGVSSFAASTDIYALGATLYCLLRGSRPPKASIVLNEGLPELPSRVSAATRTAVEHAMQPRRKDRPQSVDAFLALLDAKEDEETLVVEVEEEHREEDKRKPKKKQPKRWLWPLLVGLVAVVAFIGVRAYNNLNAENTRLAEEARLAAIERYRLDSIAKVKEAEKAARLEKHRRDSIAKAEEAKRLAEEKRKEEERIKAEKAKKALLTGVINGHEWVDLGLSVKWATCNVGASSPSDYGNYYVWGETRTKSSYTESNSITYGLSDEELKSRGIIGSDGNLTSAYDAACVNWGDAWRMPTCDEFEELKEKCSWSRTTMNGVEGRRVMGPNGNSIFLPAAGGRDGTSLNNAGIFGVYWSATSYVGKAYAFNFLDGHIYWQSYYPFCGLVVRPVSDK